MTMMQRRCGFGKSMRRWIRFSHRENTFNAETQRRREDIINMAIVPSRLTGFAMTDIKKAPRHRRGAFYL